MNSYTNVLNDSSFMASWFSVIIAEYKIMTLSEEFVRSVISKIEEVSMIWDSDDNVDNHGKWWMILDGFSDHNPDLCQSISMLLLIITNEWALI